MIVTGVSAGVSAPSKAQKKKALSGAFAAHLGEVEEGGAAPLEQVSATSAINNLFMLQEIDEDEPHARRQSVNRGASMLDYLDEIRVGLLDGSISSGLLMRLEGLIKQWREQSSDPHLNDILDGIELRAAVELAKLENV